MSEAASAIVKTAFQQNPDSQSHLKSQTGNGNRSFDDVYQKTANQNQTQDVAVQDVTSVNTDQNTNQISDAKIDQLQSDLSKRYNEIGAGLAPNGKNEILPELLLNKTRLGMLREALTDVKTLPKGTELMGRFKQVEGEYNQLEAIMKSNKDLSPGELLGLQARLYQVGQHIEVMSKVVDQVTGGIKTILNTNI